MLIRLQLNLYLVSNTSDTAWNSALLWMLLYVQYLVSWDPEFVWARHNTNQTLHLCSRKPSYKSLIVERLQLTAIFVWGSCIIWPLPYGSSVMPIACLWNTEEERRVV